MGQNQSKSCNLQHDTVRHKTSNDSASGQKELPVAEKQRKVITVVDIGSLTTSGRISAGSIDTCITTKEDLNNKNLKEIRCQSSNALDVKNHGKLSTNLSTIKIYTRERNSSPLLLTQSTSYPKKAVASRRSRIFHWRNKNPYKGIVTSGVTLSFDDSYSMLLFIPKKENPIQTCSCFQYSDIKVSSFNFKTEGDDCTQRTKIVIKDADDVKNVVSMKLRGKADCFVHPAIVSGVQVFVTRCDCSNENPPSEAAPQSRVQSQSRQSTLLPFSESHHRILQASNMSGLNVIKPSTLDGGTLDGILSKVQRNIHCEVNSGDGNSKKKSYKLPKESAAMLATEKDTRNDETSSFFDLSNVMSAVVPHGVGRTIYNTNAVIHNRVDPVDEIICIDETNRIYVCDTGLTSAQCDFIVDTTERCSRGTYTAYTYAKQTLGCRDYDEIATVCEWPVMRTYSSICTHLEKQVQGKPERTLVLDAREPHIVKYDTSKKERQKLDIHTDKSEWTFLIALSEGNGADYDGGGTYLECIDATVHLEKGHALIFPGKRRHRGQKIIEGSRFLLVGFLVAQTDLGNPNNNDGMSADQKG